VVEPEARPVARPLLDVAANARVSEDRRPVGVVVDGHQVEVREALGALLGVGDPPARVVDDVRVLPEVRVVDLADELRVLLLVELAGRVREKDELLRHGCSFASAGRLSAGGRPTLRGGARLRNRRSMPHSWVSV